MYLYPIRGPPVNTVAPRIRVSHHKFLGQWERLFGGAPTLLAFGLCRIHFRPSCLNSFAVRFAELFRRHVGDTLLSADLAAFPSCFDEKL